MLLILFGLGSSAGLPVEAWLYFNTHLRAVEQNSILRNGAGPVHQLVLRALRGSEVVIANPATIPKAIEKGDAITVTLPLSDEAAINKLFEQCRERALALASKLLPCPISDTPILYLYDQIRLWMLFNLNGAAITEWRYPRYGRLLRPQTVWWQIVERDGVSKNCSLNRKTYPGR